MAAAIPEILFVDAHFVSHLGRHEYPSLALSLLFPCQWCLGLYVNIRVSNTDLEEEAEILQ